MADFSLDVPRFQRRITAIHSHWKDTPQHGWNAADSWVICCGKSVETVSYLKSASFQIYLVNVEFTDVVMAMVGDTLHVIASQKKCDMLQALADDQENATVRVNLIPRNRSDGDQAGFGTLIEAFKSAGSNVGVLKKEQPEGAFARAWNAALVASGLTLVDLSVGLSLAMSVKDEEELALLRLAASVTTKAMKRAFIDQMEDIIDEGKKVKHSKLSDDVTSFMESTEKLKMKQLDEEKLESSFPPIVQSGGQYDLRFSAQSSNSALSADAVVCTLGARYGGYCTGISRTFFVDPVPKVKAAYEILVEAQQLVIDRLVDGAMVKTVVEQAIELIKSKDASLVSKLTKNFGFGTGLEFRDSTMPLSAKNTKTVKTGMVFNVTVGFQGIPLSSDDKRGGVGAMQNIDSVSMQLGDTIVVQRSESAEVLTKVKKEFRQVEYTLGDEDEEEEEEKEATPDVGKKRKRAAEESDEVGKETRRSDRTNGGQSASELLTAEAKREKHQLELIRKRAEEAERDYGNRDGGGDKNKADLERAKEVLAYKQAQDMPRAAKPNQIFVDQENEAIILPVNGVPVPFHIHTIKNVGQPQHEGRAHYFRINFHYPTKNLPRDVAPAMAAVLTQHGQKQMFIKEMTFRSLDARNVTQQFRALQNLRKRVREREVKMAEEADLVLQAKLIRTVDRRVPRLSDLSMRPVLSGRKSVGTLEAHANGLRYTATKGGHLDILYKNIKHALYQPCENELVVLVHFHLKNHIMVGKKKHKDVQFFTEVMESSQALDGRRRSMYDPDELDEENRERQLRQRLNATFKEFCGKVEAVAERDGTSMNFDIPYRELGFFGVPHKDMVFLQPSVNCLVNLTELPVFCVALDSVEHVHFERVMFSSKNFDMVVVFKDFNVLPHRVSAIEMKSLDAIKEWLDDIDIVFTAGPATLNWKEVIKTVREDERFYLATEEDGTPKPAGWEFLKMDNSGSEGEEESVESVFEPEESEEEDEEDDDDDDSESLVDEDSDSDEEEDDDDESEEEALSWDEMEAQAARADKQRGNFDQDAEVEERPKKKKSRR